MNNSQTSEKIRQVQERRRSNAAGFHARKSKPAPEISEWDDELSELYSPENLDTDVRND